MGKRTTGYRSNAGKSTPAAAGGSWIRPEKRLAIYARDGFACAFCGAHVRDGARLSIDHIDAAENGGTNEDENLVTVDLSCNSAKQDLSMRGWLAYLRAKGVDTTGMAARVRAQARRPIDRNLGKTLYAAHGVAGACKLAA